MGVSIFTNTLLNLIGVVPVDTKTYESHSPTATVANFALEKGAVVSDHIILNPFVLEIEFILGSQDLPFGGFGTGSAYGLRAALLYNLLVNQLEKRTLYTILTRHRLYTNMAFTELPAEHTGPFEGQLIARAKLQQISKASLANVDVSQDQLDSTSGVDFQAGTATSFGTLLLREPSPSLGLSEIFLAAEL